MIEKCKDL
jgi:CTD small phosphatase-like protein 2